LAIFHHKSLFFLLSATFPTKKQIGSFVLTELLSYLTVPVNGTLNRKSYLNARENWRNRVDYNGHRKIGQIAYFRVYWG